MKASYQKYVLQFKRSSGTSRGILNEKETWFLILEHKGRKGVGECGILRGLSYDNTLEYEKKLQWVCDHIHLGKEKLWEALEQFPSIQFGIEMAFIALEASISESSFVLFPSLFTQGKKRIPINGLVWMGDPEYMREQITEKIASGFKCIKIKIGAIDFHEEIKLLDFIRTYFTVQQIEIRVDANGAFAPNEALLKLKQLYPFVIHSIEQPIAVHQQDQMAYLCKETPIPIALDEELIGIFGLENKEKLLQKIRPQYIILKPSLIGGFKGTKEWINVAERYQIKWWITSALESNIGLNAIAQWTFLQENPLPQGLGTGGLYTNNIDVPLKVENGMLFFDV